MLSRAMIRLLIMQLILATFPIWSVTEAHAQSGGFNSGSTGADGAFAPPSTPITQSVQVPESGIFNYTTYNIPAGVTITYLPNSRNTPVTILCSGNVTIAGVISVDGLNGTQSTGIPGRGGPGGFKGGLGAFGFGDYAGTTGGGGGGIGSSGSSGPGGGGGGAILIASSGNISFTTASGIVTCGISAKGGIGAGVGTGNSGGGGGSVSLPIRFPTVAQELAC